MDYLYNLLMEQELNDLYLQVQTEITKQEDLSSLSNLWLSYFGSSGKLTKLLKKLPEVPKDERPKIGKLSNEIKNKIEQLFAAQKLAIGENILKEEIDVTTPPKLSDRPSSGHLHIVSQTIFEITTIFERIGFTRVRYPEVEWEWFAFEALNMPKHHPARDDFETFFIDAPFNDKFGKTVLSPHTSSGQVREMLERKTPPIRMINIAKCYRPNWDVSHTPMFHQFEVLVIDEGINISHLKGTIDYFVKEFFGPSRKIRLRPFHFQFTEPSFEIDINCGICQGSGKLENGENCRFCKQGWLELCGSGMVHPNVLRAGKIDPGKYSGFAFGWGVERSYMMKSGTKLNDSRLLYGNDIRFLEQF